MQAAICSSRQLSGQSQKLGLLKIAASTICIPRVRKAFLGTLQNRSTTPNMADDIHSYRGTLKSKVKSYDPDVRPDDPQPRENNRLLSGYGTTKPEEVVSNAPRPKWECAGKLIVNCPSV